MEMLDAPPFACWGRRRRRTSSLRGPTASTSSPRRRVRRLRNRPARAPEVQGLLERRSRRPTRRRCTQTCWRSRLAAGALRRPGVPAAMPAVLSRDPAKAFDMLPRQRRRSSRRGRTASPRGGLPGSVRAGQPEPRGDGRCAPARAHAATPHLPRRPPHHAPPERQQPGAGVWAEVGPLESRRQSTTGGEPCTESSPAESCCGRALES